MFPEYLGPSIDCGFSEVSRVAPAVEETVRLRSARSDDRDLAWKFYAEAVKPYIAPYIAANFHREWEDDREKFGFATWWTLENTSIIIRGDVQVGWLHFE